MRVNIKGVFREMDGYDIYQLQVDIRCLSNSLSVYEPKAERLAQQIDEAMEQVSILQSHAKNNLDRIMALLEMMGEEGEEFLRSISPEVMEEVENRRREHSSREQEENQKPQVRAFSWHHEGGRKS